MAKLGITFYDVLYVHYANNKKLTFITEGAQLLKKSASYIKTSRLNDIIQQSM
jgi:predicted nucleic acid-binding protein